MLCQLDDCQNIFAKQQMKKLWFQRYLQYETNTQMII